MPGKFVRSMSLANCSRLRIRPERGPRSVLCVVVVTMSECGTGDGCTPPATSPAMCAMSVRKNAPISSAMDRNAAKSHTREYALAPADGGDSVVDAEDEAQLVKLMRGLKSRAYDSSVLATDDYEGTIWDFYGYLARNLQRP